MSHKKHSRHFIAYMRRLMELTLVLDEGPASEGWADQLRSIMETHAADLTPEEGELTRKWGTHLSRFDPSKPAKP